MSQPLYVVEMLRFGQRTNNTYIVGVYSSREEARQVGEAHKVWRNNKYEYEISPVILNDKDEGVMEYYSHKMTDGFAQTTDQ